MKIPVKTLHLGALQLASRWMRPPPLQAHSLQGLGARRQQHANETPAGVSESSMEGGKEEGEAAAATVRNRRGRDYGKDLITFIE